MKIKAIAWVLIVSWTVFAGGALLFWLMDQVGDESWTAYAIYFGGAPIVAVIVIAEIIHAVPIWNQVIEGS